MFRVQLPRLLAKACKQWQTSHGFCEEHVGNTVRHLRIGTHRCAAALSLAGNTPFADISFADKRMGKYLAQLAKEYETIRDSPQHVSKSLRLRTDFLRRVTAIQRDIELASSDLRALNEMERGSKSNDSAELQTLVREERAEYERRIAQLNEDLCELLASAENQMERQGAEAEAELDMNEVSEVLFEVNSAVGGVESMLFARELVDMYGHYFAFKGWRAELTECVGEERGGGGVRQAAFCVRGERVFASLMFEAGVHRVQRVPATDARGRVHTSTVSVAVLPNGGGELQTLVDAQLASEKLLKVDTFSASGPGGQHVNKTQSAVRITHVPTGVVVECQEERSQIRNRELALRKLRSRLYERAFEERASRARAQRRMQVGSRARSEKIRTYNFPQDRVTDHRLQLTVHGIARYLQGDSLLDSVVLATSRAARNERLHTLLDEAVKG